MALASGTRLGVFEIVALIGSGGMGEVYRARPSYRNYDIAADDQRLLMVKAGSGDGNEGPPQIMVLEHFDEELRRLVPAKETRSLR
jgi:hypothetical protein